MHAIIAMTEKTTTVEIVTRNIILQTIITTIDTQGMLLREAGTKLFLEPVSITKRQEWRIIPNLPTVVAVLEHLLHGRIALSLLDLLELLICKPDTCTATNRCIVHVLSPCIRVHHLRHIERRIETERVVVVNRSLTFLTTLGSNKDYTTGSTRTVD